MSAAEHEEKILNTGPSSPPPQYPHSPADYSLHNRNPSVNSNGNYLHTAQRNDSVSVLGSEVNAGPHDSVSALGSEVYSPPAQYQTQSHDPSKYPYGVDSEAQFQYPQVATSTGPQSVITRDPASAPIPVVLPQSQQPQHQHLDHPQQHQQQYPVMAQQPQLHPTAYGQQGGEWQASLCDCSPCSSCLLSWCIPCIRTCAPLLLHHFRLRLRLSGHLVVIMCEQHRVISWASYANAPDLAVVGQTSERIRDPSMQNADLLNSDCLIHGAITCFTGCGWM